MTTIDIEALRKLCQAIKDEPGYLMRQKLINDLNAEWYVAATILALLDRLERAEEAAAGAVPEGFALVPVEPTPEMIAAMHFKGDIDIAIGHAQFYADAVEDYAAVLAAAPPAQGLPAAPSEPVAVICDTWELRWIGAEPIAHIVNRHGLKIGDKLFATPPAQDAGTGELAQDAARYRWLAERFTGYDFYWGGKPDAETEEGKGKVAIVFEWGQQFPCGRDFQSAIDRAIANSGRTE